MLFDQGFDVSTGMFHTSQRNGLQLNSHSRYCDLKCTHKRVAQEWRSYLKSVASGPARDFTNPNPHMVNILFILKTLI